MQTYEAVKIIAERIETNPIATKGDKWLTDALVQRARTYRARFINAQEDNNYKGMETADRLIGGVGKMLTLIEEKLKLDAEGKV